MKLRRMFLNLSIILTLLFLSIGCFANPYFFKKNQISIGFYDNNFINAENIKHPPNPLFWTATTKANHGLMSMYQRTIFHTQYFFSINFGTSFSWWQRDSQSICALSAFLAFRFWPFHTSYFNPYIFYSVAGPSIISRNTLGTAQLGENFIFQDFLGIGAQIGKNHAFNIEAMLLHYSNGDLFVHNNGFDVPLVMLIAYSF